MSEIGVISPPEGEIADFHHTSSLQVTILSVYISTSVLATIGLVLRLYTGAILVRNLGLDAFFLVASWAVYLASFIGMVEVMPCGFGRHLWNVTESGLECYKNMLLFLGVTYLWPPTLAKLSLIVLYHRINPNRQYRLILYGIAIICTVCSLVFTVVLSVPCNPLHEGTTTCLNNIALAQAILNISTDGVIIIIPMVTLWGLRMARKQKVVVGCILALGSGAVIASCVRIAYVRAMLNNPDVTYTQGSATVWSAVEINIGILCNCLAMLKPFVRRHMPWLRSLIGVHSVGGGGGGRRALPDAKNGGSGLHRHYCEGGSNRGLGYQLHSVGKDGKFSGAGKHEPAVWVEASRGSDAGSGSDTGDNDDTIRNGILVTTTVAMGRSSEGDISTVDILGRERPDDYTAISAPARVAGV